MSASRLLLALSAVAAAVGGAFLVVGRKAEETATATAQAVATGGAFEARLTGYWPFAATASEQRMEGGADDRKGKALSTLEQHQQDPSAHPYVSVSGDDAIFPYGQRLSIEEWPGLVFRVVDTGRNFRGSGKVYRALGHEPLDICVQSKRTPVVPLTTAHIVKGDHFDRPGAEVAASKFQGQAVAVGWLEDLDLLEAESWL